MTMPPRIAVTEAQIDRVVARFYSAVRQDPKLVRLGTSGRAWAELWADAERRRKCYSKAVAVLIN